MAGITLLICSLVGYFLQRDAAVTSALALFGLIALIMTAFGNRIEGAFKFGPGGIEMLVQKSVVKTEEDPSGRQPATPAEVTAAPFIALSQDAQRQLARRSKDERIVMVAELESQLPREDTGALPIKVADYPQYMAKPLKNGYTAIYRSLQRDEARAQGYQGNQQAFLVATIVPSEGIL